jgi:hypothetical protein
MLDSSIILKGHIMDNATAGNSREFVTDTFAV